MPSTEEGWHTLPDGVKLYTKTWIPNDPPTAHLIFLHGFSDHINAYYDLFPILSSRPYSLQIHGFDQRGWGRSVHSPTDAGLTGPTAEVLSDIRHFIVAVSASMSTDAATRASAGQDASIKPLFLMGHSMGGGEALYFLLSTTAGTSTHRVPPPLPPLAGCILESPFVDFDAGSKPSRFVIEAGKLAGRLLPNHQMKQKLDATYMSHDPQVRQDWVDDPLCHDTGTLAGLSGMLARSTDLTALSTGDVAGLSRELPCPLLMCHGDGDRVTSYAASKKLFGVLEGEKTFAGYPGCYHKMHAEPEGKGEEFARDVAAWVVRIAQRFTEDQVRGYVAGEGQENGEVRQLKL